MPEAHDRTKRSISKDNTRVRSELDAVTTSNSKMPSMTRDANGGRTAVQNGGSRMSITSAEDYCATTSGDDSPTEQPERPRKQRSFSRPSSRGQQSHSSAFSAASSRPTVQAFPFPLNPTVQMASASAGFNFHPPIAINSLTNSGRYSFDSLTGSCENGNWRPGSGGQMPNSLWFPPAHQFAVNPYFPFGPCYAGATPNNYVEAMRQMMPPGENAIMNGIHESSAEKSSRSSSPRNRKRALSTSPASDMMSLFSELIRSTSGSLGPIGLAGDLSSRCSSSTSRGSFSHLSAGTISPTALYACRPPFFSQNLSNYGAKLPSGSTTPVIPPLYPYPFMFMPPFANQKPEQIINASAGTAPVAQHPAMLFPGFPVFPQNQPVNNNNANSTLSSNVINNKTPSPDKSECKVTSTVNLPSSSARSDKTKPSSSLSRRSVSSTFMDTDNEQLIKKEVDFVETTCYWDSCNKQFTTQEELVSHVEHHVKAQKDHVCKWKDCSREMKPFKALYMLVVHMRHHTGEKPHKCTYENCTKAYGRLENLKTHLRSHSGEKPYHCEIEGCTKAFSNASDRAKHQNRTHSNEKPYACIVQGCSKRYTDPSSLRKHIKTVHGVEAYNNKRRKKCDSDHADQNGDNGHDGGLSSDRSPSNDETGSRNDPLGSVQSGNADSPGTFSNPTDEFCTSVSPQANDSGVEMNLASDSLSCIMESVYSSAELEAEISEPAINIAVSADGNGNDEQWQNDRPNRIRQRIALKQTLPTISSGIPYDSERRVADYMSAHYPAPPVDSLESVRHTVVACSGSGQQPNKPNVNYLLKTPPATARRESASSLASSVYGSMKSISDVTSYPALSDCSRPCSVMSSTSTTADKSPSQSNFGGQQQRQSYYYNNTNRNVYSNNINAGFSNYEPRESNTVESSSSAAAVAAAAALSACRYQTGRVEQQQQQRHCNYALRPPAVVNQQRSVSTCSYYELVTPCHLSTHMAGACGAKQRPCCCCEGQHYPVEPSTSTRPLLNSSCENYQPSIVDNETHRRFMNYEQPPPMSTNNVVGRHSPNNRCSCCFKDKVIVNNNNSCRELGKNFSNRTYCYKPNADVPCFERPLLANDVNSADYMHHMSASVLNRSLVASSSSPPSTHPHLIARADVHDIPLTAVSATRPSNMIEPEIDFSILTLRPPEPAPCPSPIESVITNGVPFERPPTVMERRMFQAQHIYQPTNLAATDMATNLMCYLKENQLYHQSIRQQQQQQQQQQQRFYQ